MPSFDRQVLRRKVSEIFVIRASGHSLDALREYPNWELTNHRLQQFLEEGVGGVILYGGSIEEITNRCAQLRMWAGKPIFLCADVEEGVGQRFQGGTWLIPPMALGRIYLKEPEYAISLAEHYGALIGYESVICGLNWVLAPVCDVNSNPLNPVINMRAWSDNPQTVADLACAFHRGLTSQGVLGCAKHFPGHGDTKVDSHLELPVLDNDLSRLAEIELPPFQALIQQGVSSIMSAHLILNRVDCNYPVTFSKRILTDLLRKKMCFEGMIVTDALVMRAISKTFSSGSAAVMAFEAGADLILMPQNPSEAIDAIVESLISGRLPISRLEDSLQRRQLALAQLNSEKPATSCEKNAFENQKVSFFAEKLIDISIESRNTLIIDNYKSLINLIRVDNLYSNPILNHSSPALVIPEQYGFRNVITHPSGISPWQNNVKEPLALEKFSDSAFLLQLFIRGNPFQGDEPLQEPWISVIMQLQRSKRLAGLILYGDSFFME